MMGCSDEHMLVEPPPGVAVLYGYVLAEGDPGVPVQGAIVRGRYFPTRFGGCHDGAPTTLPDTTDASGYYRVAIADNSGSILCARVEATPPAGSGLLPATSEEAEVTVPGGGRVDSVRVDIVLHRDLEG
jgi:hypothetical protein